MLASGWMGVGDGVKVDVRIGVTYGVAVSVGVFDGIGVEVSVLVNVGLGVLEGTGEGVSVGLEVGVGVLDGKTASVGMVGGAGSAVHAAANNNRIVRQMMRDGKNFPIGIPRNKLQF